MNTQDASKPAVQPINWLRGLAWVALLLLILAAAALTSQWLTASRGATVHDCDLQSGPCEMGNFQVSLGPAPIASLKPLTLNLEGTDTAWEQVTADLQGADMYMGQNRITLNKTASGWQGTTELAVCTTGTMRWRLTLTLSQGERHQQHLFEFDAR